MKKGSDSRRRKLGDLGEMRIIEEVILPLAGRFANNTVLGDDCVILEIGGIKLAVTADVGPRPLIQSLAGHEDDFEAAGWLAAVATASDIATAGAKPLFMINCIDAPPELEVAALESFMSGLFSAYESFGFLNAGGDIRHGPALGARITGVGIVEHGHAVGRTGARANDHLVLIGEAGRFVAAFLTALARGTGSLSQESLEWLRFPRPVLSEMAQLCGQGLIRAASDSSDGVIGAIDNLARRSGCGFTLELDEAYLTNEVRVASILHECDPWNLFFCWGDWSVVAVVPELLYPRFEATARENGIRYMPIGRAVTGGPELKAMVHGREATMAVLRNENFHPGGFNTGLKAHLDYMLRTPIFGVLGDSQ